MKNLLTKYRWNLLYALIGCFACGSYYFVRQLFIDQSAWGFIAASQLTFNIVIMFGLWGGLHSFIINVKNPYLDKVILVLGFIVIVFALRILGLKTVFG